MDIKLSIKKNQFSPKLFPFLLDYSHRWEFWCGSAGSGKSYTISQKLIIRCCNERIRVLVCRRYATTIRQTVFALFKEILEKWQLIEYVQINESDFRIRFPNQSEIIFSGLDEETKLLSLSNISCIFVEEAFEVPKDIIEQLNLRMRGNNPNQQIILAWNPISQSHWLYDFSVVNPPESSIFIHSTYKDNPFLNEEYVKSLEELYVRNPAKARIYCDGQWGNDPEGMVFKNWKVEDFDYLELSASGLEHRVGSDFGFVDPSTIVASLWDKDNKIIYVYDEFYKKGCQLDDMYKAMIDMGLRKSKIYMDSAEPRSIDYFRRQGINAVPCIKGRDSVEARIAFLQNHLIIISPKCKNVINEFENFCFLKDKKTGSYSDKMDHTYSHTIDGLGYSYSDIYTKQRLRTLDKSILGL